MAAIDGRTRLVGLLGHPIEHTLSPAMHNAAFNALGLNYCYLPLPVAPAELGAAIAGVVALGFVGVNVTIPHKQNVMAYLDEISTEAQAIGAVNLIEFRQNRRIGHNMDGIGFLEALRRQQITVRGARSLVFGAGGAARAVVYKRLHARAEGTILNRTTARAESLAAALCSAAGDVRLTAGPLDTEYVAALAAETDLVVNTTALGMTPAVESNPWPASVPYPARAVAYDLVYAPRETAFLRTAKAAGARTIDGLQMLLYQGALAFEMWTGQPAPLDVMLSELLKGRMHS